MLNIDKSKESRRLLMYIIAIFFFVVMVLPISTLLINAFFEQGQFVGFNNFIEYFSTPALFKSLSNSIYVSTVTSLVVVVLAFIFAYSIERSNIKFKGILNFVALLPLFIPTMTHAIALIYLFGENGLITSGFFGILPSFSFPLYGKWGVIIAECFYVFPAIYMMFALAFKNCDYRLYEAAEMLNTSKLRIFTTITLPSVKYTIVSGFLCGFTMVFSDFGIPKVLGGNYTLLATDIYKQVIGQSNITMGATVGIILILPSIISFVVDRYVGKSVNSVDSNAKDYVIKIDKYRDLVLGTISYIVGVFILIVFGAVIMAAFIEQWPYKLNLTFKWFNVNVVGSTPIVIFIHTIFVAIISATLGTIVSIFSAYMTQRGIGFNRLRKFIDWLGVVPLAVPGLVIGLSYLLFFNSANNPLKIIYGTFIIMIFANIVHFFSVPYMTIKSSMKKIDQEYENVSETMGVPWYKIFDDVILPLSKIAIIESFQYYFLNSMMTISAVVFLYTTKTKVAAVQMVSTYDEGYIASTAAIAVMILVANLIVKYIIELYKTKCIDGSREKEMQVYRVLQVLHEQGYSSPKKLADSARISSARVGSIIRKCINEELLVKSELGKRINYEVTEKGFELLRENLGALKDDMIQISRGSDSKVKTAVILAAGQRNDFDVTPAALKIGDLTVIEEAIIKLKSNGISKIIIVVGYGKEKLIELLKNQENIFFVESTTYKEAGSMDSLSLVSKYIDEDFILLEGDLYFENKALKELLKSEKGECALITDISKSNDEEFVQLKNGCLFKLGKDIHQFNRIDGEFVGITKMSYKLYDLMMKEYKENMNPLLNYEYILLDVARNFKVPCLKVDNLKWGEIDNLEQYNNVKNKRG